MAIILQDDILLVKYHCYSTNQLGLNVRHYRFDQILPGDITDQEIADQVSADIGPFYILCMPGAASYIGLTVQRYRPFPTAPLVSTIGAGVGTVAGEILPRQVSGIITLGTGLPGRSRRGRAYVPFPSENDTDADGTPAGAYVGNLNTLGAKFGASTIITGASGGTAQLTGIILSTGAVPPPVPDFAVITSVTARDKWATQRKRGTYGQANARPF